MNTSFSKQSQNWFFRYRLYHIPFWLLYNYLWWWVAVADPAKAAHKILFTPFSIKFAFYVVFQTIAVYINLYYLIPKFLERNRLMEYLLYLIITILLTAALIVPGYYLTAFVSDKTITQLYGPDATCYYQLYIRSPLSSTIACMTLGMSIKMARNWLRVKRRQGLLEREKLETELNFLKYQFNPHFLFNSINSIFFLIHKNPDKASSSLAKFSDLLRHQLYECNENQIPLSSELDYLKNFIELEKLRQNNHLSVDFELSDSLNESYGIAPFILMTFVENAFKHVSGYKDQPNKIIIRILSERDKIKFYIMNTTAASIGKDVLNYGGIGLKNVRRRLDLIYPDQYELDIRDNKGSFEVNLEIRLAHSLILQPV